MALHRFFSRTSATVSRWGARTRRKSGVASTFDIARVGSGVPMRRTRTVRPSLAPTTRRGRWWQLLAPAHGGGRVAPVRVGLLRVWISVEDVLVVFGGPRTGKTQYLARRIIDAPAPSSSPPPTPTFTTAPAACGLRADRGPLGFSLRVVPAVTSDVRQRAAAPNRAES